MVISISHSSENVAAASVCEKNYSYNYFCSVYVGYVLTLNPVKDMNLMQFLPLTHSVAVYLRNNVCLQHTSLHPASDDVIHWAARSSRSRKSSNVTAFFII